MDCGALVHTAHSPYDGDGNPTTTKLLTAVHLALELVQWPYNRRELIRLR